MHTVVNRWALAALVLMGASVAQAAPVTTLSFSSLLGYAESVQVQDTVGGDLTITPVGGQYLVNILGELGVTNGLLGDYRINLNEGVLLNFEEKVSLLGWDMDDLRGGSNVFTLQVDGGALQMISLQSTTPDQPEVGRSFLLGGRCLPDRLVDLWRLAGTRRPAAGWRDRGRGARAQHVGAAGRVHGHDGGVRASPLSLSGNTPGCSISGSTTPALWCGPAPAWRPSP